MASLIDAAALEAMLEERPADLDAALLDVSPAGFRIGLVELEQIVGASLANEAEAFAEGAIAYFEAFGLLEAVSSILTSAALKPPTEQERANMSILSVQGVHFYSQTVLARCAVFRSGTFMGSGCLVGPSLVLTCAHVLGKADDQGRFPGVQVQLANNMLVGVEARPLAYSPPAEADMNLPLSEIDSDFSAASDFALLRLLVPAGARSSVVEIPQAPWPATIDAALTLLHFPRGQDRGVGQCIVTKVSGPTSRWGYKSPADNGSSGGPLFNTEGKLVGIHQGKLNPDARLSRMIPAGLFLEQLSAAVKADVWPDYLWSLDGKLSGALVIGRNELFTAFRLMAAPEKQDKAFRVLRIKRMDPTESGAGLGYSVELVRRLIERLSAGHRALVLSWPQAMTQDFSILDELARQAQAQQFVGVDLGADVQGVAEGQTGQASVIKARTEMMLRTLANAAEADGKTVWIVVEHANFPLGDHVVPLEAIASIVPNWRQLRLVLVGNESVNVPMPEFRVSDLAIENYGGGTLVEYLGPLARKAVEEFVTQVHEIKAGELPTDGQVRTWTGKALRGLEAEISGYPLARMPEMAKQLREILGVILPDEEVEAAV